jgi:ribosomal protein S18 acetylase RimI-like enzyme
MAARIPFQITPVRSRGDLDAAARLFVAYADSLGIDLAFQGFAAEMQCLPGKYSPPAGELLLARDPGGVPVGCVALRPIAPPGCCEMKRLYVSAEGRGAGLGQALVDAILVVASRLGYREMRLDTLPSMTSALALYRKAGFFPIAGYYETPLAGTIFLARSLPVSTAIETA